MCSIVRSTIQWIYKIKKIKKGNVRTPNIVESIIVKLLAMRYLGGRLLMKRSEVLPLFILHVCLVPDRLL